MRFTVVDDTGTMSFVAPAHALKMLAAACSKRPSDHRTLIDITEDFDPRLVGDVRAGLSRFDQVHKPAVAVSPADPSSDIDVGQEPFRVVDEQTRRQSLVPARAGLVVFNLRAKRIVQVQNSYADLDRRGRGRLRRDGRPVRAYYRYELPPDWSIVP